VCCEGWPHISTCTPLHTQHPTNKNSPGAEGSRLRVHTFADCEAVGKEALPGGDSTPPTPSWGACRVMEGGKGPTIQSSRVIEGRKGLTLPFQHPARGRAGPPRALSIWKEERDSQTHSSSELQYALALPEFSTFGRGWGTHNPIPAPSSSTRLPCQSSRLATMPRASTCQS